jgi:hypothetical protein
MRCSGVVKLGADAEVRRPLVVLDRVCVQRGVGIGDVGVTVGGVADVAGAAAAVT